MPSFTGTTGNDTIVGSNTNDIVAAAAGNDLIFGYGDGSGVGGTPPTIDPNGGGALDNDELHGDAGADTIHGGGGDDTLDGGAGIDSLVGGAGNDIYIIDSASDVISEAPGAGTDTVQSSVTHTIESDVENLVLTGATAINGTGNAAANVITGNDAANVIDGQAGADSMTGGKGNDTYIVDNAGDTLTENAGEGTDVVQSAVTWVLASNFENLTLTGTANIDGTGNDVANSLTGNSGNNRLDGQAGADTMVGGAGNDVYVVDVAGDTVTEAASAGIDTVESSIAYTLGTNLENLTLTGTAAIAGTGNTVANVIIGNSGDNTLSGAAAADTMQGGAGNDTYVVDVAGDVTDETGGSGIDTVQSAVAWTLGAAFENLTLTGTGAINGTGNAADNAIIGNSGANALTSSDGNDTLDGGTGNDTLTGGLGNDTYVVNVATDVVDETGGGGTDTVQSAVTWTLGAAFENLTLTGATAINGTGNAAANVITGNDAANVIDGQAGADSMTGGKGNDTYIVDNAGDTLTENAGEGTDAVQAGLSWVLAANIENLTLTGTANVDGTGNDLANSLTANSGNNRLDGQGGTDTMVGGAGDDTYIVDATGDVVTEAAGAGIDSVQSSATFTLSVNVENLTLTGSANIAGTGNASDNTITGNTGNSSLSGAAGADTLIGNAANDTLDGGAGIDRLVGGAGNDVLVIDSLSDILVEDALGGNDQVRTSLILTALLTNIEGYDYTGTSAISFAGDANDNNLGGGSANDTLTGNAGNDTLDGDLGTDKLIGGAGNDTYVVNVATDVVDESSGSGTDTVQSAVTWTLGTDFENLTLTGATAINGTGNTANNVIVGNDGNNVLDGLAGADTLSGGKGDDTFIVNSSSVVLSENAGEGTDTVKSSISWTLGANLDDLILTGTADIDGTGNDLSSDNLTVVSNHLTGNTGNNHLFGLAGVDILNGGAGNDTLDGGADKDQLNGGAGDDTFIVDWGDGEWVLPGYNGGRSLKVAATSDVCTFGENAGGGIDTVLTTVAISLALTNLSLAGGVGRTEGFQNIENVTLLGTADLDCTGNVLANVLTGNDGNNIMAGADPSSGTPSNDTLIGNGGNDSLNGELGADSMVGGTGDDYLVMDNVNDHVSEFAGEGNDTVQSSIALTSSIANVENYIFTGATGVNFAGDGSDNSITGTKANDTIDGGSGHDTILGGAGNDNLTGNIGNDTLDGGGGTDSLIGGADNDTLIVTDTLFGKVDGGLGDDTLAVNLANGKSFDLTSVASQVTSIENVDLVGNQNILTLKAQDVLDDSDTDQMIIKSGGDDTVNSTGQGWTATGEIRDIGGEFYNVYTTTVASQTVILLVDESATQNIS
jgi:Ca2+-binding RTX toxin-like protein